MTGDFLIKKVQKSPQEGKQVLSSHTPFHDDFRVALNFQRGGKVLEQKQH